MRFAVSAFLSALLVAPPVAARPVSYADGWMLMGMANQSEYSVSGSYSPTPRDALGVSSLYLREGENWLHTLTYNRLLQRWNASDSQGNLFLLMGAGVAEHAGETDPAATLGIEADWETRRVYVSYENRYIYGGDIEKSFSHKARVGVAPYVGGYDDVHTWLMLQLDHQPSMREQWVVTPLVRLFNQDALGEFGVSHQGDVMFNLTFQF